MRTQLGLLASLLTLMLITIQSAQAQSETISQHVVRVKSFRCAHEPSEWRTQTGFRVKGMPGIITLSGHRPPGKTDAESLEICAEGLRRIAPYAEEKGVNLNMELLNSTVDHPHYLCDHTDWGVALCERVNSPRVKLLYDIYHMQIMEGNVIRTLQNAAPWIGHYHTAGVPGRHELDEQQELNYPGICRAINATGYTGYLGHEFMPGNGAHGAEDGLVFHVAKFQITIHHMALSGSKDRRRRERLVDQDHRRKTSNRRQDEDHGQGRPDRLEFRRADTFLGHQHSENQAG